MTAAFGTMYAYITAGVYVISRLDSFDFVTKMYIC